MRWIPEPKPPSGGLAAEGFYKLLGRPRLDPLTVLVRETAQNSWDARIKNGDPVLFSLQGWQLDRHERAALLEEVFVQADEVKGTELASALNDPGLMGLYIADRNTKGLGGPLQADQVNPDGTYDWVDFVLNVGEANTQGHTGGTYGFGKTISYVVSEANAIVIHSRTYHQDRLETRLIACAIGERFTRGDKLYTGRHWWGESGGDVPVPLTGPEADRVADLIGMPQFVGQDTGTNILVVAPDLGGRTPEQAMRFIAESVTWHLWPKLTPRRGQRAMDIDVSWNDVSVTIPKPEDRPPLHGFAQAFQALLDDGAPDTTLGLRLDEVRCGRPKADIGVLATVPLIHRDRVAVDDGSDPDDNEAPQPAAAITGICHHVALLRTPELVVDYLEGPPPPEGGTEWAGVFRAHDDHDAHFAAAEPPTHDSWNPELLPKSSGRTIVNVGLREIKAALENRWAPRKKPSHVDVASTALVADELSHLVGAVDGRGKGKRRKDAPPPKPGGPARPKVDLTFSTPIELADGLGTLARLRVSPSAVSTGTILRFSVAAALDGSSADANLDPGLSFHEVRVAGRPIDVEGRTGQLTVDNTGPFEVELVASRGPETTVLFDVEADPVR